ASSWEEDQVDEAAICVAGVGCGWDRREKEGNLERSPRPAPWRWCEGVCGTPGCCVPYEVEAFIVDEVPGTACAVNLLQQHRVVGQPECGRHQHVRTDELEPFLHPVCQYLAAIKVSRRRRMMPYVKPRHLGLSLRNPFPVEGDHLGEGGQAIVT